jgi:preprotein translocase subunit SecE
MDDKKKESKPTEKGNNAIKNVFQTYRAEFRKIVWPSKQTLFKHTVTVIAVSLMFGAYIAANDYVFGIIFQQFVSLIA